MQQHIGTGVFQFHENGFEAVLLDEKRYVKWQEIEEIHAYKIDLLAYDEICLDIVLQKTAITLPEVTAGWHYFIKQLGLQFTSINRD